VLIVNPNTDEQFCSGLICQAALPASFQANGQAAHVQVDWEKEILISRQGSAISASLVLYLAIFV
jgi:hypothetical protein